MNLTLTTEQANYYANAKVYEEVFFHAHSQGYNTEPNKQSALDCAKRFLSHLEIYERGVPEKVRKALHNFCNTKSLANTVIELVPSLKKL